MGPTCLGNGIPDQSQHVELVSRISNGLLEELNSLVQAAKAKARGYSSFRNLKTVIYLIAGKLDLQPTHLS